MLYNIYVNERKSIIYKGDDMSKVKLTGYDYNYHITDTGRVYKNEKLLSPANNGLGYLDIKLWKGGKRVHRYVHRLVWQTFVGEIPAGYEVNHKDHNKANNSLSNLELVTHSVNLKKAVEKYGRFGFLK